MSPFAVGSRAFMMVMARTGIPEEQEISIEFSFRCTEGRRPGGDQERSAPWGLGHPGARHRGGMGPQSTRTVQESACSQSACIP